MYQCEVIVFWNLAVFSSVLGDIELTGNELVVISARQSVLN
jgi:hypothetical protein